MGATHPPLAFDAHYAWVLDYSLGAHESSVNAALHPVWIKEAVGPHPEKKADLASEPVGVLDQRRASDGHDSEPAAPQLGRFFGHLRSGVVRARKSSLTKLVDGS